MEAGKDEKTEEESDETTEEISDETEAKACCSGNLFFCITKASKSKDELKESHM